jgi:hypothetical protein
MATRADIIRVAKGEIGYSRWADKENGTKYGRWYARTVGNDMFAASGVPYCDMFVSWVLSTVGIAWRSAYVPGREAEARSRGVLIDKWDVRPGDAVTFDFDGAGIAQHIGIVDVPPNSAGVLYTVDGNTTWGTGGPQDNGGVVARRERNINDVRYGIRLVDDYAVSRASDGSSNITGIQTAIGATPDNILGPDTEKRLYAVVAASGWAGRHFPYGIQYTQSVVGTNPDGVWGDASDAAHDRVIAAIQRALGVEDDGIWGPVSQAAWERFRRNAKRP